MECAAAQRSSREPQAIRRGHATDAVGGGAGVPRSRLSRALTEEVWGKLGEIQNKKR